jgi:iron complex transport system substrate-binding protein
MITRRALLLAAAAGLAGAPVRGQPAERIVVAGGDLTEIVVALGAGERIVGVDSTSLHPPEMRERAQIGYVRRIAPEGVLTLAPDLLIGAADAGPAAALDKLRAAGLRVELAPEGGGAESVPVKIAFVGRIVGREAEAAALAEAYRAEMARLAAAIAEVSGRPRVLFVLSIQNGAPLVGGSGTSADAMIALAGGVNAATGFADYKPMNREAVIAAAPDVLLMMDGHANNLGGAAAVLARPEMALTPAGRAGRAVVMDGLLLLGFGPRTPEAVRRLAALLHPDDAARLGR